MTHCWEPFWLWGKLFRSYSRLGGVSRENWAHCSCRECCRGDF